MTTLPIVPKGIKTAHDVKLCAELGFKGVYISNHGGRVVDLAPTAVEILLDVHKNYPEVFSQLEIYTDGGVRRASHVLALLALGARAVGLGRPAMFANIYGQSGVAKMINILRTELTTEMQLMGEADINRYRGNTTFVSWLRHRSISTKITKSGSIYRSTLSKSSLNTLAHRFKGLVIKSGLF